MECITVVFREDGTVSEGFEKLVCSKCGQSLELYEFHNGKYIVVCSHSAENPEPFERGTPVLR